MRPLQAHRGRTPRTDRGRTPWTDRGRTERGRTFDPGPHAFATDTGRQDLRIAPPIHGGRTPTDTEGQDPYGSDPLREMRQPTHGGRTHSDIGGQDPRESARATQFGDRGTGPLRTLGGKTPLEGSALEHWN